MKFFFSEDMYDFKKWSLDTILKIYCGYKYTRPCMINRIWGLEQL